jgi:hypothetical protein
MITADVAATQGAFFEVASHCYSPGKSWLVTKSADGIGYISIYRMCAATPPHALKSARFFVSVAPFD